MNPTISKPSAPKLSICITTFNRSTFIGETLDSVLAQTTNDCEVVILDGGSTDDTEAVVAKYTWRFDRLRYVRQEKNCGLDRDCDRVVQLAEGEYCWLMSDDDLLKPGAIEAVLKALHRDLSLVIVNTETRDFNMVNVIQHRWLNFEGDRVYEPEEMDRLFVEVRDVLKYIGCIVIKRTVWLSRDRARYYDSLFIHVGAIFQERLPGRALVIAEPLISYRMSNTHTFSTKMFEVMFFKWPSLVWSLSVSESAKNQVCELEPWRSFRELLLRRGFGSYSMREYQRLIRPQLRSIREALIPVIAALLPGTLANAIFLIYYSTTRSRLQDTWEPEVIRQLLRESRFYPMNWRIFKRTA